MLVRPAGQRLSQALCLSLPFLQKITVLQHQHRVNNLWYCLVLQNQNN